MEKFNVLSGVAAPILTDNIDTDTIIPAAWMRSIHTDPGKGLFGGWRYDEAGGERTGFILNKPGFRDAKIILAGRNFGCGSSRENAVWALLAFGIRCVIAPSFGDIFHENCIKNGLLPVALEQDVVQALARCAEQAAGGRDMGVDLQRCEICTHEGERLSFSIDPRHREALLAGLDEIERSLAHEHRVAAFQQKDRELRPWIYDLHQE